MSVASQWELMVKALAGRIRLPDAPERFLWDPVEEAGFRVLSLEPRHVLALPSSREYVAIRSIGCLVAQALVEEMSVVTGEPAIARYPVDVLW